MTAPVSFHPIAPTRKQGMIWLFVIALIFTATLIASLFLDSAKQLDASTLFQIAILAPSLLALIWFDAREFRLPDSITLPLILAGLVWTWRFAPEDLMAALLGGAIGYGTIWLVAEIFERLSGRSGIGLGDAKLIAAGGVWLTAWQLPLLVLISSGLGIVLSLIVQFHHKDVNASSQPAFPFGISISISTWLLSQFEVLNLIL